MSFESKTAASGYFNADAIAQVKLIAVRSWTKDDTGNNVVEWRFIGVEGDTAGKVVGLYNNDSNEVAQGRLFDNAEVLGLKREQVGQAITGKTNGDIATAIRPLVKGKTIVVWAKVTAFGNDGKFSISKLAVNQKDLEPNIRKVEVKVASSTK